MTSALAPRCVQPASGGAEFVLLEVSDAALHVSMQNVKESSTN